MFIRKIVTATALVIGLAAPMVSLAQGTNGPCVLEKHHVTSVRPYKVEEHQGRASVSRFRGADVFIQAEPGLTAEWLRHEINGHIAEMHGASMKDCALLRDVQVQVDSAGAGFSVKLIGQNEQEANEILRRARTLLNG